MVDDDREVRRPYVGVPFERAPMTAVFGLSFVALDPDRHRLRVCTQDD
ncbi:glyoxalase [Burkholderia lata]|nr:hypothetical protein [Burkholderia lata]VWB46542.1 glyoxalase [Burkholderia lata]